MCDISFASVEYINYITFPSLIALILLGFSVLFANLGGRFNRLYFFTIVFIVIWIMSDYLGYKITNPLYVNWTERSSALGLVAAAFITLLIYVFPENETGKISKKVIFSIFFPMFLFLIIVPTKFYVKEIGPVPTCETITGSLFWLMVVLLIYYIFLGTIFIIKKIKILNDHQKKQVRFITSGTFITLILVVLIDIIPTLYKADYIVLFSPYVALTFAAFFAYAIVKYKVFSIKLIATQALVAVLVILIGSELFFAENTTNQILILITLALSLGFGYMLIKSVKLEVERKEELQLMSNKLAVANDQLRKLDNSKSEFISIASHQLRTPLTAIKGFVSLLLEGSYGKLMDKQEEALNKTYNSTERLINLVEDLLNVSRMESGRMEFKFAPTDMTIVCQEIIDTFVLRAKDRKLSLEYKKPTAHIPELMIDAGKVKEVVSNMVDNALKYTPKGGVTLKLTQEGDNVRVTVSDTGIGIPATELPYLFNKFSRGKDTSRLNTGGTGLGLYVGKGMIENNGGRIWAESDGEGKGSRFIIELPIKQSEELLQRWS